MNVVTEILGTVADGAGPLAAQFVQTDALVLTSEERLSPHGVAYTAGGRKVRLSLPRGLELGDGDVLAIDAGVAIVVTAAPEDVFVVAPASALDWGRVGFNLGNLHRPVRFTETAILTPADPLVADLFQRLGIVFERQTVPFTGQRSTAQTGAQTGALAGHSHDHAHQHGHDHPNHPGHGHRHHHHSHSH